MWKVKAAQYGMVLSLALTGVHYVGIADRMARDYIADKYNLTEEIVIGKLAQARGYEKPQPKMTELDKYELVEKEALRYELNPSILRALMHVESKGNQYAVSSAGAIGLLQIMPFNSKRCGLKHYGELFDDKTNIRCGAKIFSEELRTYGGNVTYALHAYNGGAKCQQKIKQCGEYNKDCLGGCIESVGHARMVLAAATKDIR